ncbi:MAG: lysophospholipid acyltransferase family protein [Flammeovirgaceae bacterium]|nr:lysophospholipid acyltransferase family protein [Flammeovirgaceae bacterium]
MSGRPLQKRIKYAALYFLVRSLLALASIFPRGIWIPFCGWLGGLAYFFEKKYKVKTIEHLTLVFGNEKSKNEILALSKQVYIMAGKNAGDVMRSLRVSSLSDLEKFLETTGFENYEVANAKGKGVIFLACHIGAFDLQVTYMALKGLNPHIIGTTLKDERLTEILFTYRNAFGAVAIERGKETFRLLKALKNGGSIAILIDQDTKVKSCFVDFFGIPASTPIGAAVLALKTRAAVVPSYVFLGEDGKQHMQLFPEIPLVDTGNEEQDIVTNTQNYTHFIEEKIRKHPEQWVWMHERWKTRPGEEIK